MAIGTTGTLDTETGERRETQFSYTPVDPQEDMMRQAFERSQQAFNPPPPQPQGPIPYWENPATYYPRQEQPDPVAQSKAATAAAYKYIAFRGYQQDLKEGKSAADAFAKWGPMLVADASLGPSMKAMTPPAVKPSYAWDEQNNAFMAPGERPIFRPEPRAQPQTRIDPLTLSDYESAQTEFTKALKIYQDPAETEQIRTEAGARMRIAKARMENIRKSSGQPVASAAIQSQASESPVAASPFKEGARLKNKQTGKFFIVKNGVPVPE